MKKQETRPGIGVDSKGGEVIDPTKNVLDLVKAESKYQDAMRGAGETLRDKLASAESRRIDDLANLRLQYDARIAEDLRIGVKTTSEQLAAQLVKETTSLSNLIGALRTEFTGQIAVLSKSFTDQIVALTGALTPRLSDLERFRWESGGRTSVSDPVMSEALARIDSSQAKMAAALGVIQNSESRTGGAMMGRDAGNARFFAIVMAIAAVAGPTIAVAGILLATHGR